MKTIGHESKPSVTDAYLDGISEGRSFFKANPGMSREEMQRLLTIAAENVKRHSSTMKDCFKAERDFWKNQLRKEG